MTTAGYRVLETSHPPVYYFPPEYVRPGCCTGAGRPPGASSRAGPLLAVELAGAAGRAGRLILPDPTPEFAAIAGFPPSTPRGWTSAG